jgi:tetratricopeptide (TPR) repeat protein
VATFPGDPKIYALYTQQVKSEADTVIPRGLALFPKSAELLAINARELRSKGRVEDALASTRQALTLDSTMAQGVLSIAQMEIELGRPDSALASLRVAVSRGEDTSLVAQFALSKGNSLYRAANGTQASRDFELALRYLSLADTLRSSPQSRFLTGAAALGLAQSSFTEAAKLTDKTERLMRRGADMMPVARTGLVAGQELQPDAAKQALGYLEQLEPYAAQQMGACGPSASLR